jgi:hypothetical protein
MRRRDAKCYARRSQGQSDGLQRVGADRAPTDTFVENLINETLVESSEKEAFRRLEALDVIGVPCSSRTVEHRGRTVLAMGCALAGAESRHGRPLNSVVSSHWIGRL